MFKLLRLPLRLLSGSCRGLSRNLRRSNVTLMESEQWRSSYLRGYGHLALMEQSRTRQMIVQIVDALRFGDEGKAFGLLWNSDCKQLSAEDLLPILGYCSTAPKPLVVEFYL